MSPNAAERVRAGSYIAAILVGALAAYVNGSYSRGNAAYLGDGSREGDVFFTAYSDVVEQTPFMLAVIFFFSDRKGRRIVYWP